MPSSCRIGVYVLVSSNGQGNLASTSEDEEGLSVAVEYSVGLVSADEPAVVEVPELIVPVELSRGEAGRALTRIASGDRELGRRRQVVSVALALCVASETGSSLVEV